jgi:glucan-binding YG repeat protein
MKMVLYNDNSDKRRNITMNKRIKRIIAVALTVSSLYTVSPVSNFMTTKAYASTSTSDSQLRSIYLSDGSIDFSSSTYSYTVRVGSSVDDITVTAKPKNTNSTVEIDGTDVDSSDSYRDTVSLSKGSNTIKVKVTDEDNKTRTYTLNVYRGTSSSYDDVYLRSLYLSDGNIDFDKDKTSYYVNVNSSVDDITITAKPEDSDDTVRIDGTTVDDSDKYKKTVSLDKGSNKIEVEVEDDSSSDSRTYTLNINRGSSSTTQNDKYLDELSINDSNISLEDNKTSYDVTTKDSVDEIDVKAVANDSDYDVYINGTNVDSHDDYKKAVSLNKGKNQITIQIKDVHGNLLRAYTLNVLRGVENIKANQWVEVSGKYQYNDAQGNPKKNTLFYDSSKSKSYYLDQDGYRVTGWKQVGSSWYLFDTDGSMIKGWKNTGGAWYYLQDSGAMVTGWLPFGNGQWYYLNSDGSMRTGWLYDGGKYYYFYSDGSMAVNTTIGGYRVGSNGAWIR